MMSNAKRHARNLRLIKAEAKKTKSAIESYQQRLEALAKQYGYADYHELEVLASAEADTSDSDDLQDYMMPPQSGLRSPVVFQASNPRLVGSLQSGLEECWVADITAACHGYFEHTFKDVIFVEQPGALVLIDGIHASNAFPDVMVPELASSQWHFLAFLRVQNAYFLDQIGPLVKVARGCEFSMIGKATAAYARACSITHNIGVAYLDENGQYHCLSIPLGEEYGF